MCGLPGYGPRRPDRLDVLRGRRHRGDFSAGMDRPLRLTSPEATGLLVALRALAEMPGWSTRRRRAARSPRSRPRPAPPDTARRRCGRRAGASRESAAAAVRAAVQQRGRWPSTTTRPHTTRCPPDRRPDPGRADRRPQLPGGVVARRPKASGCSGSTASIERPVLDEPSAPPRPGPARRHRHLAVRCRSVAAVGHVRVEPSASWMFEYYPMRLLARAARTVTARRR